jgi:hypothetical protein
MCLNFSILWRCYKWFAIFILYVALYRTKTCIVREIFRVLLAADRTSLPLHSNRWRRLFFLLSPGQSRLYFHNTQCRPVTCVRLGQVSLKAIFLTLFRPSAELTNLIYREGVSTLPIIFGDILPHTETWVSWCHISDCSSVEWRLNAPGRCPADPPDVSRRKIQTF